MIRIVKSPIKTKKYRAELPDGTSVDFGAAGYSDYTKHKDPERKQRYIIRHQKRENWTPRGIHTAGFWSRWLLWGEPTLNASKRYIQNVILKNRLKII
jgi:hypothetical protein